VRECHGHPGKMFGVIMWEQEMSLANTENQSPVGSHHNDGIQGIFSFVDNLQPFRHFCVYSYMSTNRVKIQNAQFTLYYLLVTVDGEISENEKTLFFNIVCKAGGFTRSYAESVFNAMHRFAKTLNYKFTIESLSDATTEEKAQTIKILRELSFADGSYHANEVKFIGNVQKDLEIA
jgi:uncharacterized tellurite resistance protein B-like protein